MTDIPDVLRLTNRNVQNNVFTVLNSNNTSPTSATTTTSIVATKRSPTVVDGGGDDDETKIKDILEVAPLVWGTSDVSKVIIIAQ